jgi:hypothetical protein
MFASPDALPLYQQLLLDLIAPPIVAGLWWAFSRAWAIAVQGQPISVKTRTRQARLFWIALIIFYLTMISVTAFANLTARETSQGNLRAVTDGMFPDQRIRTAVRITTH